MPGLGNVVRIFAQFADELWNNVFKPFFQSVWDGLKAIGGAFVSLIGSIPGFGGLGPPGPALPGIPGQDPGDEGGTAFTGGEGQHGGLVRGATTAVDALRARLTDGEFVMRREAVARIGVPALQAANAGGGGMGAPVFNITIANSVIGTEAAKQDLVRSISAEIVV